GHQAAGFGKQPADRYGRKTLLQQDTRKTGTGLADQTARHQDGIDPRQLQSQHSLLELRWPMHQCSVDMQAEDRACPPTFVQERYRGWIGRVAEDADAAGSRQKIPDQVERLRGKLRRHERYACYIAA